MLIGLFVFMLIMWAICNDINEGIPNHIREQNLGIINGAYIMLNILAPFIMGLAMSGRYEFILYGILLYILAYAIKRITRKLVYGFYFYKQ